MDRVLVPGVAHRLDDAAAVPVPLVRLQRILIVNTSDTPERREAELFGDRLEAIWKRCLTPYDGVDTVPPDGTVTRCRRLQAQRLRGPIVCGPDPRALHLPSRSWWR